MFKNLSKNSPVFVIDNSSDKLQIFKGTVTDISSSRADVSLLCQVFDLTVSFDNRKSIYTISENTSGFIRANDNTFCMESTNDLVNVLNSLKIEFESTIKSAETAQSKLSQVMSYLEEYDNVYRQNKEYTDKFKKIDDKFETMDSKIDDVNSLLQKILNLVSTNENNKGVHSKPQTVSKV